MSDDEQRNDFTRPGDFTILGVELACTCGACPEQYDAYIDGDDIGYLRLRHGSFEVEYPDVGGELVFSAAPEGDGRFEPEEREGYLTTAVRALLYRIRKGVGPDFERLLDIAEDHERMKARLESASRENLLTVEQIEGIRAQCETWEQLLARAAASDVGVNHSRNPGDEFYKTTRRLLAHADAISKLLEKIE